MQYENYSGLKMGRRCADQVFAVKRVRDKYVTHRKRVFYQLCFKKRPNDTI